MVSMHPCSVLRPQNGGTNFLSVLVSVQYDLIASQPDLDSNFLVLQLALKAEPVSCVPRGDTVGCLVLDTGTMGALKSDGNDSYTEKKLSQTFNLNDDSCQSLLWLIFAHNNMKSIWAGVWDMGRHENYKKIVRFYAAFPAHKENTRT